MNGFFGFATTILFAFAMSVLIYIAMTWISIRHGVARNGYALGLEISPAWADRIFIALIFIYAATFGTLSVLRYLSLSFYGFDLAIFDQAIWNSLNGRLLEVSLVYDTPTLLGQRFSPILLGFVPLYVVWSSPIVLLVVQTLALSVAAFPVYWIARKRLGYTFALVISACYFLFPALGYVNLAEFHEVALVTPLFAFATFFLLRRHYKGMLVCLGVALLAKEEISFSLIVFGSFICFFHRRRVLGVALALFGLAWGILLLQLMIPMFRGFEYGTSYYYFTPGPFRGPGRYDYLGSSLGEVIKTLMTHPDIVLQKVFVLDKLYYLFHFLVPLAFIPLIGAEAGILALPTLGISLLGSDPYLYSLESHYAAPILPFFFVSTTLGIQRVLRLAKSWKLHWRFSDAQTSQYARKLALMALIFAASSASYYFHSPGPFAQQFVVERYTPTARAMVAYDLMHRIPEGVSLIVDSQFAPHMAHRRQIYMVYDLFDYRAGDYVFIDMRNSAWEGAAAWWESWFSPGYYEKILEEDDYVIAKRRAIDVPRQIRFEDQMTFAGYTIVATDTLRGGTPLRPIVEWRAEKEIGDRYKIRIQVQDDQGHIWAVEDREPQNGFAPTNRWQVGKTVADQYALRLPPTMPPGDFQLLVQVYHSGRGHFLNAFDAQGQKLGDQAAFANVYIAKDKGSYTASQLPIEQPLFVDMQEMRFLGYVPPRQTISPGELLQIGLYWRARAKPHVDYIVAVQLRDADGSIAFEHAARPAHNTYPTTRWDAGEVLLDWHDFLLPRDLPAGEYQIAVVLRDAMSANPLGEALISRISVIQ